MPTPFSANINDLCGHKQPRVCCISCEYLGCLFKSKSACQALKNCQHDLQQNIALLAEENIQDDNRERLEKKDELLPELEEAAKELIRDNAGILKQWEELMRDVCRNSEPSNIANEFERMATTRECMAYLDSLVTDPRGLQLWLNVCKSNNKPLLDPIGASNGSLMNVWNHGNARFGRGGFILPSRFTSDDDDNNVFDNEDELDDEDIQALTCRFLLRTPEQEGMTKHIDDQRHDRKFWDKQVAMISSDDFLPYLEVLVRQYGKLVHNKEKALKEAKSPEQTAGISASEGWPPVFDLSWDGFMDWLDLCQQSDPQFLSVSLPEWYRKIEAHRRTIAATLEKWEPGVDFTWTIKDAK